MLEPVATLLLSMLSIPGMALIAGALAVPLLPASARNAFRLALIAFSGWTVWQIAPDASLAARLAGIELTLLRVEAITKPFALVFHIAAALDLGSGRDQQC